MTHSPNPFARRVWRLCLLGSALLAATASGGMDLLVYNSNNNGPGSLRQAVNDNNALGGGNTIIFSNTVTGTITLTSEMLISTNVTILGPGPDVLTVSGNNSTRVFNISGVTVAISGLTIANGRVQGADGAGIRNAGELALSNCVVRSCTGGRGGGVYNQGSLRVINSTIRNNSAPASAGGIANFSTLGLLKSSVVSNAYTGSGPSSGGGGIYSAGGTVTAITNCTISGNSGGLAAVVGNPTIWNSTIAGNDAEGVNGGGGVGNSIIAGNGSIRDVFGAFTSAGYNLIGRTNLSNGWGAVGDQVGTFANPITPNLLPLGNYGGSTPTMPPAFGSPAIDQGKNFGGITDQRGRVRTYDNPLILNATLGDGTDIGAVEVGNGITLLVTNSNNSGPGSLRQAILDASSIEQDTVTFAPNVTNTITLISGEIELNKPTVILGPTNHALTVSGNNSNRVFHLTGGGVFLSGLTIANGLADYGGGILADAGILALSYCQIVSNAATGFGGGMYARSNAVLILDRSSVTHNQAVFIGGGIAQGESANVAIYSSTITGNRTTFVYDGILNPFGGGIALPSGTLLVVNSTIASNVSTRFCGGICNGLFTSGTAEIRNSIIAGNTSVSVGPDVLGPFTSGGYNLIGNTNASTGFGTTGDQLNVNPLLGPLANYGGPTLTMALRSGSPAMDKGKSFSYPTDQRGSARPLDDAAIPNASGGDGADIGAYEADPRFLIVELRRVGSDVALSLMTVLGRNYRAEYANDLASVIWPVFTNNAPGNGHLLWVTNFGGANEPRRFYRSGSSLD